MYTPFLKLDDFQRRVCGRRHTRAVLCRPFRADVMTSHQMTQMTQVVKDVTTLRPDPLSHEAGRPLRQFPRVLLLNLALFDWRMSSRNQHDNDGVATSRHPVASRSTQRRRLQGIACARRNLLAPATAAPAEIGAARSRRFGDWKGKHARPVVALAWVKPT
jgi:hypothetical protein